MSVNNINTVAIVPIFHPILGKRNGEIIAIDIPTMEGRIYITSISKRNDNMRMKIVPADAGKPTKNFSSFIMWKEASLTMLNDKNTMRMTTSKL